MPDINNIEAILAEMEAARAAPTPSCLEVATGAYSGKSTVAADEDPTVAAVAGVKALNAEIVELKRREAAIASDRQKLEKLLEDETAREPGSGSSGSGAPADKVPPGTPETSGAAMLRTMGLRLT